MNLNLHLRVQILVLILANLAIIASFHFSKSFFTGIEDAVHAEPKVQPIPSVERQADPTAPYLSSYLL